MLQHAAVSHGEQPLHQKVSQHYWIIARHVDILLVITWCKLRISLKNRLIAFSSVFMTWITSCFRCLHVKVLGCVAVLLRPFTLNSDLILNCYTHHSLSLPLRVLVFLVLPDEEWKRRCGLKEDIRVSIPVPKAEFITAKAALIGWREIGYTTLWKTIHCQGLSLTPPLYSCIHLVSTLALQAVTNFVMYRFGSLQQSEWQTMYDLAKMFLYCFNHWKLELPSVHARSSPTDDQRVYRENYMRWREEGTEETGG